MIPCSGSEYNGELGRQVAIYLNNKSPISSFSSEFCTTILLKNVLLKKDRLVEITLNNLKSSFVIIIDGCKTSCASEIFKTLGITADLVVRIDDFVPKEEINLNDMEAFKKRRRISDVKQEDIEKIANFILEKLKEFGFEIEQEP